MSWGQASISGCGPGVVIAGQIIPLGHNHNGGFSPIAFDRNEQGLLLFQVRMWVD